MMEEMDDINWQTELKQIVKKTIKERKKQRLLARAQEGWNDQAPNDRSRVRTTENYHENRTHEIHFGSKH